MLSKIMTGFNETGCSRFPVNDSAASDLHICLQSDKEAVDIDVATDEAGKGAEDAFDVAVEEIGDEGKGLLILMTCFAPYPAGYEKQ